MTPREMFSARVLLHMQGGMTHQEALKRAMRPLKPALGDRQQPQSPAHAVKS